MAGLLADTIESPKHPWLADAAWALNGLDRRLQGSAMEYLNPFGGLGDYLMPLAYGQDPGWMNRLGAMGVAGGALGAVGPVMRKAGDVLDMSRGARMSRAKDQGYLTEMPLYHGTAREFNDFDPSRLGDTLPGSTSQLGVWLSPSPDIASEHARLAADLGSGDQPNVLPLFHRFSDSRHYDLEDGDLLGLEVAGAIQDAWDEGADSILFDNYTMGGKFPDGQAVVVKDPSQLRSINAAFDPKKIGKNDMLGRADPRFLRWLAPIAGAGYLASGMLEEDVQESDAVQAFKPRLIE